MTPQGLKTLDNMTKTRLDGKKLNDLIQSMLTYKSETESEAKDSIAIKIKF